MQPRGTQPAGEARGPRTLEECLRTLEPLSIARGQLVATDGALDLRLSVERGVLDLELTGHELPKGVANEAAVVRAVADTVFWDAPLYDVNAGSPFFGESKRKLHIVRPDAPRELCRAIAEEVARLEPLRRRIPSLTMTAQATPSSKDAKGGSPVAVKLRAALVARPGELLLAEWARAEGLSFVEVAAAFAELLDANEAKVARKQDPASSAARIEAALKGGGFCPGLRAERAARALIARDPARAAAAFVKAGHERLASGRLAEALECFQQAGAIPRESLPDLGVAALEGLLVALDADAKDQRRPAGTEARSPAEVKRVALDLGRTYVALGLMNRARAALERALDEQAPPAYQLELVEALVGAGQLGRALDRAEALAPRIDRTTRRALAQKLAGAGAKGPSLDRALALAGVQRARRIANVSLAAAALAALVATGFGLQAAAASSLASAVVDAKARLAREGPSDELADGVNAVGARYFFVPAGAKARRTGEALRDLSADAKLLAQHKAALAWRSSTDPDRARAELKRVMDGAKTDALRSRVADALAALDRAAQQCHGECDLVRGAADQNDSVNALDYARRVMADFPAWKSAWRDLRVPVRIHVARPEDAVILWDGERVTTQPPTGFLTLDPGRATLAVKGDVRGWKPEVRTVDIATAPPTITITLEREPGAPPIPGRRRPRPDESSTAADPNGSKPDAASHHGKITIGGDTGPDPTPPSDGDTPPPRAPGRFEVREVLGTDIQRLLGGGPVDVLPSPGYFDFLLGELPRDGRLRLSVDVLTRVHDHKVWLGAVRLRLEDTVLGHYIEPQEVKPDDDAERPVQAQQNGRRAVLALDRCVGLDQGKFKSAVRDELVSMIRKFNKDEGQ